MNQSKRKRTFVDVEVQSAIVYRVLIYWLSGMLFILMPLTFLNTWSQPDVNLISHFFGVIGQYWPILLMMFIMLPFAMYDVNRFSNRFVGPIYRVRKELDKFEKTGELKHIKFREKDYWQDLAGQLNTVSHRIKELESELESLRETEHVAS